MAEAVVEDPIRFFCHQCNVAINQVLPEFKCPNCNTGFIEELEAREPSDDGSDSDMDNSEAFTQQLEQLQDIIWGGRPSDNTRSRRNTLAAPSVIMQPFEHLIQDVIVNLNGVGWSASGAGGRGNGPVFFLGNPGDYAWGREGLDAIVSHLLNQMDGTGPPPLAKEKIEEIPTVNIVEDQVDKNLQCSVCWEDFRLGEPVRKLRCEHVYHENCIIPWLELHGTCPICRKTLTDESGEEHHQGQGGTSVQNSLAALFRAAQDSVSSRSTPSFSFSPTLSNSSASSSGTSGSSSQHSDQNHDCHLTDLE
ncbi:E3 ubiquitin-protein ligase Iruka isoform X1 [Ischnura elegans]|uniref:E3 ubiquitin-protein ligase Iruka isoform X1 n=1 Tax=Ischnura elegans TaxID=197161 RepID=UPI001ED87560|nr:E3 ubiquitin-protein ligase Iruka isoform X1 [Ischnura elegans]